ncbi:MAG: hypothetical protein PHY62_11235 [Gallionella sp.]|jgi:hypothetical protein|nr:hypothetical protein [Gallionella sp.]
MSDSEQEVVEHKVRRAVGASAMRRIGDIVAAEQRDDEQKAGVVRWFVRYAWLVALGIALFYAYWAGVI